MQDHAKLTELEAEAAAVASALEAIAKSMAREREALASAATQVRLGLRVIYHNTERPFQS